MVGQHLGDPHFNGFARFHDPRPHLTPIVSKPRITKGRASACKSQLEYFDS